MEMGSVVNFARDSTLRRRAQRPHRHTTYPCLPTVPADLTREARSALPTSLLPAGGGPVCRADAVRDPQRGLT
jgi:hypothetical protein